VKGPVPVEASEKVTVRGAVPEVGEPEKSATGITGGGVTVMTFVVLLLPTGFATVRFTVYVPLLVKVCEGLWIVDVLPSPKSHAHEVGELVEVSVNWTDKGAYPDVTFVEKLATGAPRAEIYRLFMVLYFFPLESITINLTE
jgi:hypothetical protein